MKFLYEYRTSDNVRHDGVINAPNRDAAFAALKERGIRPGSVSEAPGFFNKLFGKGKRWITIGVLGLGCLVLGAVSVHFSREAQSTELQSQISDRHQIYGDAAIIMAGVKTEWRDVLENPGDRILAKFVQPGVVVARIWMQKNIGDELMTTFQSKMETQPNDLTEYRQVKAIVRGLRVELRQYLDDGGSAIGFLERLDERQNLEASIYRRLEAEVLQAKGQPNLYALWQTKNEELRALGIRTIPLPEELEED